MIVDSDRLSLVLRTLRVDEACWRNLEENFSKQCPTGTESLDFRIRVLKEIWKTLAPHEVVSTEPIVHDPTCPLCLAKSVTVAAARQNEQDSPLVYGKCDLCGLGILIRGGSQDSKYSSPHYYNRRNRAGVGYESYLAERNYREAKGRSLIEWIRGSVVQNLRTLLEVGSGFGFTRTAAEDAGLRTNGIDINPHAARIAETLYAQKTFTGTLEQAIRYGEIETCSHDVVLYQFVLEHIADPTAELKLAVQMLSPRGVLVLAVPNMNCAEREIFGASYRSFRGDHLWLFSQASIKILLKNAGLKPLSIKSECNIRLLSGFLSDAELNKLDAGCRSADLLVIAQRR